MYVRTIIGAVPSRGYQNHIRFMDTLLKVADIYKKKTILLLLSIIYPLSGEVAVRACRMNTYRYIK